MDVETEATDAPVIVSEAPPVTSVVEGNVIRNVAYNESFRNLLLAYDSSDSSDDGIIPLSSTVIQETRFSTTETSDDDEPNSEEEETCTVEKRTKPTPSQGVSTVGELGLDDLPPVPDLSTLSIDCASEQFVLMGYVMNVIGKIVTIESIPNSPAYDLDTVLFLHKGQTPFGVVFDVLGPVAQPIYCIRFNSVEDIDALKVETGLAVYSAPLNTEHTQYVFLQHLLKIRGSDASWLDDNEVPPEYADYSDDEAEQEARRANRRLSSENADYKGNGCDTNSNMGHGSVIKTETDRWPKPSRMGVGARKRPHPSPKPIKRDPMWYRGGTFERPPPQPPVPYAPVNGMGDMLGRQPIMPFAAQHPPPPPPSSAPVNFSYPPPTFPGPLPMRTYTRLPPPGGMLPQPPVPGETPLPPPPPPPPAPPLSSVSVMASAQVSSMPPPPTYPPYGFLPALPPPYCTNLPPQF